MKIYGVALLALCFLTGKVLGNLLGKLIGINSDVGGVGFAMLLLIVANAFMKKKGWMETATTNGILFWSSMYIPIIVAMAATLNVKAAVSGGLVALVVGVIVTLVAFYLVPLIAKIGQKEPLNSPEK
ncbi:MAG: malonate transporter subunit MadL [Flavobacteriaceae bacterium]|nr:MAG: malonate transporter subunit MadL [Flavobacteriaceae bacterium]